MGDNLWDQLKQSKGFKDFFNEYNASIGNSLKELNESPYPIQGRDKEIEQLYGILERPRTPVAILLGQAGVGKSATVEEFARQLNSNTSRVNKVKYLLVSLQVGSLKALGTSQLQAALSNMLSKLKDVEDLAQMTLKDPTIRIVLFIDEVHMLVTIFGPGTKIGGDLLKAELARTPIRVITATTRREYDSTIAVDRPLAERFKQIEMHELPKDVVKMICKNWWSKIAPEYPLPSDAILDRMLDANALYRAEEAEPRKSLDVLEDFVSYCKRTGKPVTHDVVDEIFKRRFSISLTLDIDPKAIFAEITRRVKGQPHALSVLRKLTQSLVFRLDPVSNKPLATALFTGSTGTGKSETTKAIADGLYPGENAIFNVNMPDYKTVESEAAFRKRIGERIRHVPNTVLLLDELEKAHVSVLDSLLAILDEGLVTFSTINREGQEEPNTVSLRNTVVIATTNAGHEVFKNDAKYSSRTLNLKQGETENLASKAEVETLMKSLHNILMDSGFKPELLGRFNRIVPYRSLEENVLLMIAENHLIALAKKFKDLRGYSIYYEAPREWDSRYPYKTFDVALYITFTRAKANDPNSGGARKIKHEIDSTVYDAIIDAITENPQHKAFKVSVSRDAEIYSIGAGVAAGGVVVSAIQM